MFPMISSLGESLPDQQDEPLCDSIVFILPIISYSGGLKCVSVEQKSQLRGESADGAMNLLLKCIWVHGSWTAGT